MFNESKTDFKQSLLRAFCEAKAFKYCGSLPLQVQYNLHLRNPSSFVCSPPKENAALTAYFYCKLFLWQQILEMEWKEKRNTLLNVL